MIGGPLGDCGLTGRKIIVDTYGGYCAPRRRRVLRQGSVEGRPLGRLCRALRREEHRRRRPRRASARCRSSYAIGVAQPTSASWSTTFGTGKISDEKHRRSWCAKHFDLRPKGIIQMLDLLRPIYEKTAAYGHFGRDEPEFTWETTDKAAALDGGRRGRAANGVRLTRRSCSLLATFPRGALRPSAQRLPALQARASHRHSNGALNCDVWRADA